MSEKTPIEVELGIDLSSVDRSLARLKTKIDQNAALQSSWSNRLGVVGNTIGMSIGSGAAKAERSLKSLAGVGGATARELSKSFGQVGRVLGAAGSSIKLGAGISIGMSAVDIAKKIPSIVSESIESAATLKITEQRMQRTFGDMTADASKFARDYSEQIGIAQTETKKRLAKFSSILEQTNLDPMQRTGASKTGIRLASDLASAWGTNEDDAMTAMLAALRGEADPIERYGLNIKEAAVNTELLKMGIIGGSRAATESQKVMARFNLIVEQTKNIHGVAAKQAGTYARETSRMGASWQTLLEKVGTALEPAATHLAKFTAKAINGFGESIGPVDRFSERILDLAKSYTDALEPMQVSFLKFVEDDLPSGVEIATGFLKSLRESFDSLGQSIKDSGINSLNGSFLEWLRGRARGDDMQSLINGPEATNAMNDKLKDLASTPTHTSEQYKDSVKKARVPLLRSMAIMVSEALSGMLKITHGSRETPPSVSVAAPADENTSDSVDPSSSPVPLANENASGQTEQAMPTTSEDGYGKLSAKKRGPMFGRDQWTRMQDALRATTGIDIRGNAWGDMTIEEKRKSLYDIYKKSGKADDATLSSLPNASSQELDRRFGMLNRSGVDTGGLATPKDSSTPFTSSGGPFERIGAMLGDATRAITGLATMGINAAANPDLAEAERQSKGSVGFYGLQDLQKNIQMAIGEDEARKDKIKIEIARKQQVAAEQTAEAVRNSPTKIAEELMKIVGLQ